METVEEIKARLRSPGARAKMDPETLILSDRIDALLAEGASRTPTGREKLAGASKALGDHVYKRLLDTFGGSIPPELAGICGIVADTENTLLTLAKRNAPS